VVTPLVEWNKICRTQITRLLPWQCGNWGHHPGTINPNPDSNPKR